MDEKYALSGVATILTLWLCYYQADMADIKTRDDVWYRRLAWLYLIGGLIVVWAALMLSIEVFNRLKNPAYVPVCNLNPVLSCTSVADSAQAHVFGFPNYFLGLAGYAAIATVGGAMLAGAKFNRWFWRTIQLGMTFAFGFMTYLQFQSLYRIGALCLFCMVLWTFTGPLFGYTTLYNLRQKNLTMPKRLDGLVNFALRFHAEILLSWYLLILGLILKRFWYYWSSVI
jgi:uncharacterized membrane protein